LYKRIYTEAWEQWYKVRTDKSSGQRDFWDEQDLADELVSNTDRAAIAIHPAVFCDEAQDFTRIELDAIFSLSVFSNRLLGSEQVGYVPIAFAGDPYQTINPTGFDWGAVKAEFHGRILEQLDQRRTGSQQPDMNYRELRYNYRSSPEIIKLSNLVQLVRGVCFNLRSLLPQRGWWIENSTAPAYFSSADPQHVQALHKQTGIVIIIPCHEGEELDYIAEDKLLSSIPADSRNVMSAMSAKGLEFNRVVLYNFGEQCVTEYSTLLKLIAGDNHAALTSEALLPLQYYVNRLYVAMTRAKRRLLIMDTERGIDQFWRRLNQHRDSLLQKYHNASWTADDLVALAQGTNASWSGDEDDPSELAKQYEQMAEANTDVFLWRLAAQNHRIAGNELGADYCEARRYEQEQDYNKSADFYLKCHYSPQALRCIWIARDYQRLATESQFGASNRKRAAQFMISTSHSTNECNSLLKSLASVPDIELAEGRETWLEVVHTLTKRYQDFANKEAPFWARVYDELCSLYRRIGSVTDRPPELADIAFKAGRMEDALEIGGLSTETITEIKAHVEPYPRNLVYLEKLGRYEDIIQQWKASSIALRRNAKNPGENDKALDIVYWAFRKLGDKESALRVLLAPEVNMHQLTIWFDEEREQKNEEYIVKLGQAVISEYVTKGYWDDAHKFATKKAKQSDSAQNQLAAHLVREVARRSQDLNDATITDRDQIRAFLASWLVDSVSLRELLSVEEMGAALEKAGHYTNTLKFYEREMRLDSSSKETRRFARERWLKTKQRQVTDSKESARDNRRREFEDKLREYQLTPEYVKELPAYPVLVAPEAQGFTPSSTTDVVENSSKVVWFDSDKIDNDQIESIHLHAKQGWDHTRIAKVLQLDLELVDHILNENQS
jgi:hypothetical protein